MVFRPSGASVLGGRPVLGRYVAYMECTPIPTSTRLKPENLVCEIVGVPSPLSHT